MNGHVPAPGANRMKFYYSCDIFAFRYSWTTNQKSIVNKTSIKSLNIGRYIL